MYFQQQVWADRKFFNEWVKTHLKEHIDRHHVKYNGSHEDTIVLYDNLYGQKHPNKIELSHSM